jgi:phosphoribosylaminoimidazole-succinocarboxamide synthase
MDEPIPEKGRVLTGLTYYWTHEFEEDVPSALVTCDPEAIDLAVPGFLAETELHGRTMLARRAEMLPLECIVRARLAGGAYDEYVAKGTVHGMPAPRGLRLTDPFPEPVFNPSTKEETGHDLRIDLDEAANLVGLEPLAEAQAICLDLFSRAAKRFSDVGLVLADTKFELGYVDGRLVVCDEVITPDSSRIWPADQVHPGEVPPAFDKQPFRDWLDAQGWDRTPPPPPVHEAIVEVTSARYVDAYERATGRPLSSWYGF